MQEKKISFAELKAVSVQIIDIIGNTTGYEKQKIGFHTSINNDIGIDGDDWDDILLALYKNEKLTLDGFNFYDYFQDEAQISNNFIIHAFFFPAKLFLYLFTFRWKYKSFNQFAVMDGAPKQVLTIGDLITSKIEGRFVKRSERKFVLK